ncbi:hypothetical protein N9937_00775 [bacterium]|nr:hypothetical protein [bacterium]
MIEFNSKIVEYRLADKGEVAEATPEEVIIPDDVKLPDDSPARMKVLKTDGKKWYLTIVYHEISEQPFALFCHTNSSDKVAQTSDAIERLLLLAQRKGILSKHIDTTLEKTRSESNVGKLTRVISLLLRHGVLIKNIVSELDKMEDIFVGSFLFQIKKFLSQYIQDGEEVEGEVCPACGSPNIVFKEGCKACLDCNESGCG